MAGKRAPVVLVANNPFGHHLLTSQLLHLYRDLPFAHDAVLLCNGVTDDADPGEYPWLRVVSFATSAGGVLTYINLVLKLLGIRRRHPRAAYHVRGFVAGSLFFASQLGRLRSARYIYDPRGAFFLEWHEAGRPKVIGRLLRAVEWRLFRGSVATIVTSERFAVLYERIFGDDSNIVTIYNSTSFPSKGTAMPLSSEGPVRIVYLGTFNYWHDMDEVVRVMDTVAEEVGAERVEISIYTLPKFHDAVKRKLSGVRCASVQVDYVKYSDIPDALADKHIGVSVVRPTPSTEIASPIKIADYVALGLVPLMNAGIGDFDEHFRVNRSGIVYEFGSKIDLAGLRDLDPAPNGEIHQLVSREEACRRLAPVVERLLDG